MTDRETLRRRVQAALEELAFHCGYASPETWTRMYADDVGELLNETQAEHAYIEVHGPRPNGAFTVYYVPTPDALADLLKPQAPMTRELWATYAERTRWLSAMAGLCAGLHPEQQPEFGAFLSRTEPPLVTVVLWTTPPCIAAELPIVVADTPPHEQPVRRPIFGVSGEVLNS